MAHVECPMAICRSADVEYKCSLPRAGCPSPSSSNSIRNISVLEFIQLDIVVHSYHTSFHCGAVSAPIPCSMSVRRGVSLAHSLVCAPSAMPFCPILACLAATRPAAAATAPAICATTHAQKTAPTLRACALACSARSRALITPASVRGTVTLRPSHGCWRAGRMRYPAWCVVQGNPACSCVGAWCAPADTNLMPHGTVHWPDCRRLAGMHELTQTHTRTHTRTHTHTDFRQCSAQGRLRAQPMQSGLLVGVRQRRGCRGTCCASVQGFQECIARTDVQECKVRTGAEVSGAEQAVQHLSSQYVWFALLWACTRC